MKGRLPFHIPTVETLSLFCLGESNCDPNRKTDTICALDMENHLSENMRAAEESRLILGAE